MPSIRSQLFKFYFRQRNRSLDMGRPLALQRANLDRLGAQAPVAKGTQVLRFAIDGIPAEWIDGPDVHRDRVLLYLHGGGYCVGSCTSHRGFVSRIAGACRARLLLPEYRLAPEHPFPAALEDACAVYRYLLAQGYPPEQILVGGDSAGGGLAVALLLALRDEGQPLPAAAVLISPWTDLQASGDSLHSRAKQDPWLRPVGIKKTANVYRGKMPADHPLISPLYADMTGLSPLLIHVGDDEILLDDSTRLAAKAAAAGVDVQLTIWEGLWHVFHAFFQWVPEVRQANEEIGAWVEQRCKPQRNSPYYNSGEYLRAKHQGTTLQSGRRLETWALDLLPLHPGATVLDIGCGWGRFTWPLIENYAITPSHITCCDRSPGMLQTAAQEAQRRAHHPTFVVAALPSLPFAADQFEGVMANHMLYHLEDIGKGVRELARLVREDGWVLATTNSDEVKVPLLEFHYAALNRLDIAYTRQEHSPFSMENGQQILSQWFQNVERFYFEDETLYHTVDEVMAHYRSIGRYRNLLAREDISVETKQRLLEIVREQAESIIHEYGVLRSPVRMGAFVCRHPRSV